MVPKPENDGGAAVAYSSGDEQAVVPIMGVVQKVPSVYSASEGEDCAKLVKNGQLDNFTPARTMRRQELSHLVNESDCEYRGRSVTRSTLRRSKSEHRPNPTDDSFTSRRSARSSSRDQIKVGDRVIIKNKYLGTCRYVGPIEEENFQLPEVWYGVELDEKLTQNSGIFGSREYFACAFGHGLMVMGAKIKKVRTPNVSFKNGPSTTTLRPSKSMSNLSSRTRVSQGADSWVMSRKKFASQHPMATLNRIKQIQQATPGQVIFDETPRDPYGALLHTFQTGADGGYAHDNLLRRSFERIVPQEINNQLDYGLYRNRSLPPMHGQSPEAMMAQFSTLQRSTSAPQYDFNRRRPSFMSTGSGSISHSIGSNPADIFYRPANGGQLCEACIQCKTCMPVAYGQQVTPTQKSPTQNHSQSFTLPKQFINRNQSFDYGHEMFQPGRKVAFNSSTGVSSSSSASSTSSSGVSSSASSTTGSTSSLDEIAPMTEPLSIEYERWKSTYGLNRGRSMKKGLAKLSMALQA